MKKDIEVLIQEMLKVQKEKKRESSKRLQQRTHKKWGENMGSELVRILNELKETLNETLELQKKTIEILKEMKGNDE